MSLRILIAGAGLGGLALAHGLRSAGLEVALFERQPADAPVASSYRIHIDANGSRALHACLPPAAWHAFDSHSAAPPRGIGFATEHLASLAFIPESRPADDPVAWSHPIGRAGLRKLLMAGLEDAITFDARLTGFDQSADGQVVARLADGRTALGDVLVGADGSASMVRRQYLPRARVVDSGVAGIAGKLYLSDAVRQRLPGDLLGQMTMVLPASGSALFLAGFQRRFEHQALADLDLPEHLFWVLIGHPAQLGLTSDARQQPAELHQRALERVARWHPLLRWIVAESDPASHIGVPLHTAERVTPWQTSRVTLLGDAIHTMTPLQGLGGNTALRDAAVLARRLIEADRGESSLLAAIHAYETDMLEYGFAAVERSRQISDAVSSTNVLGRVAFRSVLRVADAVPWLHRRMFERPTADLANGRRNAALARTN
jgi:2-polyprenyl-6-methoxyphenol hydroxylase-like FAD-dependent oxidoreductase